MQISKLDTLYNDVSAATKVPRDHVKAVVYALGYTPVGDTNLMFAQQLERIADALEQINFNTLPKGTQ